MVPNIQKSLVPQNKKQRIIAIALVVVTVLLVWQIYGLFFAPPPSASSKKFAAVAPPLPTAAPSVAVAPVASPTLPDLTTDLAQQKYLQLLEEYKIVELQKMIASDKQAIAAAQASTMESLNKINQLGGQADFESFNINTPDAAAPAKAAATNNNYSLVYTGLEDNEWTATLKKGNSTYDVVAGTVLEGNYKVTDINNNEVELQTNDKIVHLTFDGSSITPLTPEPKPTPTPAPSARLPTPSTQGIVQTPVLPQTTLMPPVPAQVPQLATPRTSLPKIRPWYEMVKNKIALMLSKKSTVVTPPPASHTAVATPAIPKNIPVASPPPNMPKTVADLDPQAYTIQLAILASSTELQNFIQLHHLTDQYFTYQEKNKKKRLGIIYGVYTSRAEAQAALDTLPTHLTQAGPYVVSIKSIQAKI